MSCLYCHAHVSLHESLPAVPVIEAEFSKSVAVGIWEIKAILQEICAIENYLRGIFAFNTE